MPNYRLKTKWHWASAGSFAPGVALRGGDGELKFAAAR